jgi:hypothetical protein
VADRKFTITDAVGRHYSYCDKIIGEIEGILTGFSGELGTFQVFTRTLKNYVNTKRDEDIKTVMYEPLLAPLIGPTFDQVMLQISQLQREFYDKYPKNRYNLLMGI